LLVALASCGLGVYAVMHHLFWLLVLTTVVAGYYSANAQLYRFAAAELCEPAFREKAVSLVMAGGLLGAVIGPNLATYTRDMLDVPFAGAYAALAVVALVALVIISFIRFPATPVQPAKRDAGRSLREIARQPTFVVAALTGALSYGVMNLLMAATPLAMQVCGLSFENTALVLQWHVIGMFAPGFFTGHLIKRFGTLQIMAVGAVLNFVCILIALSGIELHQFLWSSPAAPRCRSAPTSQPKKTRPRRP
jgi:predicted MFS family arabinose efflux permease